MGAVPSVDACVTARQSCKETAHAPPPHTSFSLYGAAVTALAGSAAEPAVTASTASAVRKVEHSATRRPGGGPEEAAPVTRHVEARGRTAAGPRPGRVRRAVRGRSTGFRHGPPGLRPQVGPVRGTTVGRTLPAGGTPHAHDPPRRPGRRPADPVGRRATARRVHNVNVRSTENRRTGTPVPLAAAVPFTAGGTGGRSRDRSTADRVVARSGGRDLSPTRAGPGTPGTVFPGPPRPPSETALPCRPVPGRAVTRAPSTDRTPRT
ncbi:hypothetical protein GCM10010515_73420 [Streptomyces fructofermentans]|uniref:Uncharacterized protein n=1 Tax=Streptomyces fructofermentans TaxID=152141 RepID=A0A918NUW5_9ACTN|nr:hypothetical protein GCM10010515_73420 [Streptomyces fructofermentans]